MTTCKNGSIFSSRIVTPREVLALGTAAIRTVEHDLFGQVAGRELALQRRPEVPQFGVARGTPLQTGGARIRLSP
jgi:hypothetical protein